MRKSITIFLTILFSTGFQFVSAQPDWTKHSDFPSGAKILDMESDNSGKVYILTAEGEVYYTDDKGLNWHGVPGVFGFLNTLDIEVDEVTGTLYIGTTMNGILWTSDLGQTWNTEYIYTTINGFHATFYKIGVDHGNGIIVGSEPDFAHSPIYTSLNNGNSWISQPVAPFAGALDLLFLNDGSLLAACEKGVYKSPDNGASWNPLNTGIANFQTRSIAKDNVTGLLYAATDINLITSDSTGCGVYVSSDSGVTWNISSNGIANRMINEITVDFTNGDVYALSPDGIYRSDDNAVSWTLVNLNLNDKLFSCIDQQITGEFMAGAFEEGVVFSAQPVNGWSYVNNGLADKGFADMVINRDYLFLLMEETGDLFRKRLYSNLWERPGNIQLPPVTRGSLLRTDSAGNVFVVCNGWNTTVNIKRSPDDGNTWSDITTSIALPAGATSIQFLDFKIATSGNYYLIAEYKGMTSTTQDLFKSIDGGLTWTSIQHIPGNNLIAMSEIDLSSSEDIYVSALTNSFTNTVISSFNLGSSFSVLPLPANSFGNAYDLFIDANQTLFFSTNNILNKRMNGVWTTIPNGGWDTDYNLHPVKFYTDKMNNFYAASLDDGIFFSNDSSSTWTNITAGLPLYNSPFGSIRLSLNKLSFDDNNDPYGFSVDDDVEAASFRGIYIRSITAEVANNFPSDEIILSYPNPVNNILNISLENINKTKSILIYDVYGRVTERFIIENESNGTVRLNVEHLKSGSYLVKVNSELKSFSFKFNKY